MPPLAIRMGVGRQRLAGGNAGDISEYFEDEIDGISIF
jgi:hypothetical protein